MVRVLLAAGGSPHLTDQYGCAPIHLVFSRSADLVLNSYGMCGAVPYTVDLLDAKEVERISLARTQIVQMLLEAGANRFLASRRRPSDDPAAGSSHCCPNNLTVANMASTQLSCGGTEVLRLLGTCFAQPRSLKETCRLAYRRLLPRPITQGYLADLAGVGDDKELIQYLLFSKS